MKRYAATALVLTAIGFTTYVTLHPGIAFAATPLSKSAPRELKAAGKYTIDPMHTSVGFEIDHLGLSRVQGRFDKVSGNIVADPANLGRSSVNFSIETESVDTNVAPRDADLKSPNFFDAANNPAITFKSTKIVKRGAGYVATGELTLHGVTKLVSIPFKAYGPITDPWKAQRIGIVSDPIIVNREDYGMKFDVPLVGSKVEVRLSVEATLDK